MHHQFPTTSSQSNNKQTNTHIFGLQIEEYNRERNLLRFELESREHDTKEYFDVREQHARLTLQHYAVTCELDKLREENEDLRAAMFEFEAMGMGSSTYYDDIARRGNSFYSIEARNSRVSGHSKTSVNGTGGSSSNPNGLLLEDDDDDIEVDMVVGFPGLTKITFSRITSSGMYGDDDDDDDDSTVESEHDDDEDGRKLREEAAAAAAAASKKVRMNVFESSGGGADGEYDIPIQNLKGKSVDELIDIISRLRSSKFDIVKSFRAEIERLRLALSNVTGDADPNVSELLGLFLLSFFSFCCVQRSLKGV